MQQLCSVLYVWVCFSQILFVGPLFQKAELQNYKTLFWMMSCSLIEQWRKKNIILAQKINPFFMTFRSLSWYANIQGVPISFNQNIKQTQKKIVKLKENLQCLNVSKISRFFCLRWFFCLKLVGTPCSPLFIVHIFCCTDAAFWQKAPARQE